MDELFYDLVNVVAVPYPGVFEIDRANAIVKAVERHRDFKIVQQLNTVDSATTKLACIVVDVECDGVTPKNRHGIKYRERLALCVPENEKQLVNVLALRKEFPRILHQNQGRIGTPASLCLYFEPPVSVARTWTPQNFLARIQWWLQQSALDTLHPTDQAVEQLFFVSNYELVLPWDFSNSEGRSQQKYFIHCSPERANGGITFFLKPTLAGGGIPGNAIQPIELTLPSILHGQVENDPATLGELTTLMTERGVEMLTLLRERVQESVGIIGKATTTDSQFVVILLLVPIVRAIGGPIERVSHRAFLINIGLLKLGAAVGALFLLDGQYFKDAMGKCDDGPTAEWKNFPLFSMGVLHQNSPEQSRIQSGVSEPGPEAVLVGAGAIGSALLDIWTRSGWGKWTVIDQDHIKPHNLVRHTADTRHIGLTKTEAVSNMHWEITAGASELKVICADVCDLENEQIASSLKATSLIIDASAALDYPRLASSVDGIARNMSVFLTPSGNAAVLMAEDADRSMRLRTLEAQYYRALIHETWGNNHLDGNLGTYWSGASCRDISMALPYSRVLGHAGNLADQVQIACQSQEALIRAWARDVATGSVVAHAIPIFQEVAHQFGELTLYIDKGVFARLRDLRQLYAPNETGGVLIGYYDLNMKAAVIVDGLPAPADSVSTPTSFTRGTAGLPEAIAEISRRTSGIVRYLGEWHSHPPGHSANPSGDDLIQLTYLALGMAEDGLPAVSMIIGEDDITVLQGTAEK
ncbi:MULTISPECIES: ThiF family adenylyltransferase [Collimonas]|uniref:Prokaryotic E2 A family protein n=2 Tax=Collimonas TaxID=202907 RepID=A0A127QPF7_9BURK|nr:MULTISPECIES: ThiF family adenylyltransferase [Collimonas]AMP02058.1 prokaryotic E2 A family protein [Collimonas arenae]AMP11953.1 prokaryotic E2 A family protein [Collimonas arenae]AMP17207.1 prokaryotic E2 A family protein [Collimonas pratensis]